MRSTANGYHIIPFLMEVCVYMCWHMRTDIYSDLLHYFHNFGIYLWELFLPNIRSTEHHNRIMRGINLQSDKQGKL